MANPKIKLPRSVIVLNIVMVLIILAICGLSFSLAFNTINSESQTTRYSYSETLEASDEPVDAYGTAEGESGESPAAAQTTRLSVSMTKRTTDPEDAPEPVIEETEEPEITAPADNVSRIYSKEFFKDDLFIGDSISTGLYLYNKLDAKNVAAAVGYTPYKAYNTAIDFYDGSSMTALDYALKMQPKRIFVMLGSNGMASSGDIEAMKDSYRTLLEKLSASCPKSKIYCLSVTPVTADSTEAAAGNITNEIIRDFNAYLKSLSGELGVGYMDIYSLLIDDTGYFSKDYAEVDGLHFLGKTYDVMLSYIQNELS